MPSVPHSIRIPEELDREIGAEIERRGHEDWTSGALELLQEAVRTAKAPGIVFVEGRRHRRAAIAFSGLEVWEVVATWRESGCEWDTFRCAYPELSEHQLRAALNYYALFPDEIDARLAKEAQWSADRVAEELPFSRAFERSGEG